MSGQSFVNASDRPLPAVSGANTVNSAASSSISGMYSVEDVGDWCNSTTGGPEPARR